MTTFTDRFWAKVDKSAAGGCWEWKASLDTHGYGHIGMQKKLLLAHRVAYELLVGVIPPGMEVDHICHNRACCNPEHLRLASDCENARNAKIRSDNTSGYKGVTWHKRIKKWCVSIMVAKKSIHIGYYSDINEAAEAYKDAAKRLHGEFANYGGAA